MSNSPGFNYQAPIPKKATTSLNKQFGYSLHSLTSPSVSPGPHVSTSNSPNVVLSTSPSIPTSRSQSASIHQSITPSQFDSCALPCANSPCYFSSLDNCCQHKSIIPQLEDLLDDCFKYSINQPIEPLRKDIVIHFKRFVNNLHTEENLAFLIEIFKYEYFYDKIFPQNIENLKLKSPSPIHYSNSFLNRSLDQSIDNLPYPTISNKPGRATPKPKDDGIPSVFVDDIDTSQDGKYSTNLHEVWDNLRDLNMTDEDDSESMQRVRSMVSAVSEVESSVFNDDSNAPNDDGLATPDRELLIDQWNLIINHYIQNDAPEQINISNKSSRKIMEEHKQNLNHIHNPIILVHAKNEILQLIKENAYLSFTKNYKPTCDDLATDFTTKPIVTKPTTPTPTDDAKAEIAESPSSLNYDHDTKHSNELMVPKPTKPNVSPSLTENSSTKKKSRFLHLSSPNATTNSSSSNSSTPVIPEHELPKSRTFDTHSNSSSPAPSSISNLLGHLKIHHNPSFTSTPTSPVNVSNASLKSKTFATTGDACASQKIVRPASASNVSADLCQGVSSPTTVFKFGKLWKSKRK